MKTSSQMRRAFLDFFVSRGHTLRPSAPLVPQGDATLMFNSAGMVPFKPYFLGQKKDLKRATSCQRCFRTTDIERVGTTLRHLTFFEMLGNFSFGDYFKAEAIPSAWEFLTKDMALDPKLLHPTVYEDDDEALSLWKKQPLVNQPVKLGAESNFWNMGPTGPCGPCSEIYIDLGAARSCGEKTCAVGCDCDRYLEIWNLVFMQFDRQEDGSLKPLPGKNIDTGMGLERLAFAAQGKASPFDTDLFSPIVMKAAHLIGVEPGRSPETALAFRVIADHARAATMLMAEGLIPSNVERGYVLRRLIRRALRYGQLLGHGRPFLHELVPTVSGIFAETYPAVGEAASQVASTLKAEEEKFLETLEHGERELKALLDKTSGALSGEQAFRLYETFGFPLELTKEICAGRGLSVDEAGYAASAARAAEVARASWKGSGQAMIDSSIASLQTEFTGYESLQEETTVVAVQERGADSVVVLEKTPFYPEGGGQVGDEGQILSQDGRTVLAKVIDTQKQGTAILHIARLTKPGAIGATDRVIARVDAVRRAYIAPHHTGTHLLNEALRRVLGAHVRQAGSYVGADKLRFDFTHPQALDPELLKKIETIVADEIEKGEKVETRVLPVEKVKEFGATTLLGEDYGAQPRFVLIGARGWQDPKDRFSLELCGGTHCKTTSEIAAFKIVRESSVASGVRRIEALAGKAVADFERVRRQEDEQAVSQLVARERELLDEVSALGGRADESPAPARTAPRLRAREKELKELIARLKAKKLAAVGDAGRTTLEVNGLKVCVQRLEGADPKSLRGLSDKVKAELGSGLVFLAAPGEGKLSFILTATPDLAAKGVDAARIAKAFAAANGGSAGGRADFAQGGAVDRDWEALIRDLAGRIS